MLDYPFLNDILKRSWNFSKIVVADNLVKNLVLLERHYFGGKLAANFIFEFPMLIPKSENSVEFIYDVPKLSPEIENQLKNRENVHAPNDTFVFIEGQLIVHRRAKYTYYEAEKE